MTGFGVPATSPLRPVRAMSLATMNVFDEQTYVFDLSDMMFLSLWRRELVAHHALIMVFKPKPNSLSCVRQDDSIRLAIVREAFRLPVSATSSFSHLQSALIWRGSWGLDWVE